MLSIRNQITLVSSIIVIICLQGCAFEKKTRVFRDTPNIVTKPIIPSDIIAKRIMNSREILKKDDIPEEKKEIALSLIEIYNKLRSMDMDNAKGAEYRAIIKGLFDNLGVIEKKYLYIFDISDHETRLEIINDYLEMKKKISENYLVGNYNGVISQCAEFESKYGKESLTPEIGLFFTLSLAQKNMVKEALSIGKKIIKDIELNPDLIFLTANIIKWELETGNSENARSFFEKMLDNINEKNALFKKTEDLFSEYENSDNLDILSDRYLSENYKSEDGAAEANLKRVEKLIKEENFAEARLLLLRWRLRAEEGPEVELIEQALKSVEAAEERLKKEDSNDKINLDEARDLVENEKYEEAIKLLESISNETLDLEVNKLKKTAVEKLINKKTLEAAVLFRKAKDSNSPDDKKTFLLSSKKILESLIETYPDSPLVEKLKSHQSKVNYDLENLP